MLDQCPQLTLIHTLFVFLSSFISLLPDTCLIAELEHKLTYVAIVFL